MSMMMDGKLSGDVVNRTAVLCPVIWCSSCAEEALVVRRCGGALTVACPTCRSVTMVSPSSNPDPGAAVQAGAVRTASARAQTSHRRRVARARLFTLRLYRQKGAMKRRGKSGIMIAADPLRSFEKGVKENGADERPAIASPNRPGGMNYMSAGL